MIIFKKIIKLISLIHGKNISYNELMGFLLNKTLPSDYDFLSRTDAGVISEIIISPGYYFNATYNESPNNAAKIGFLIQCPFHFYLYKNIYKHLPESEFILDAIWVRRNIKDWQKQLSDFTAFLKKEKVNYRIYSDKKQEDFFGKYEVLVSHIKGNIIGQRKLENIKKVRVMYGHSKDLWNFGAWSRHFDLALAYGSYSNDFIGRYTRSVITGNARFDRWFAGQLNQDAISEIKKYLEPRKKNVLYLPTHGALSSLEMFLEAAPRIAGQFNLIIKPHHLTLYGDPDKINAIKNSLEWALVQNVFWADDFIDLEDLLAASDVVVSDNSGAIFDALLVDKPLVICDFIDEISFGRENWKVGRDKDIWSLPQTYSNSVEQRIKKDPLYKIGEVIKSPTEINLAINTALILPNKYLENRYRLKRKFFSHCDGTAGKKAAEEIRRLLYSEKTNFKRETLLALETDAELLKEMLPLQEEIESFRNILKSYMNISEISEPIGENMCPVQFSVVVPTYNRDKAIESSIRSVLGQKYPSSEFELIIVDDGSSNNNTGYIVREIIAEFPESRIKYVKYDRNRGVSYARNIGILIARGELVAFTDDDCIVPQDWLAKFKKDFEENIEISGVGGWYIPRNIQENKKASLWERYIFWWKLPGILYWYKSFGVQHTGSCGNTANVCYRKNALKKAGGFNLNFPKASTEDIELKFRMLKSGFVLLSVPRLVVHDKKFTFRQFMRDYFIRSWSNHLIYKLHPEFIKDFSPIHAVFATLYEIENIMESKYINFKDKLLFLAPMIIRNACLAFSKYWIAANILYDQEKSDTGNS